MGLSTAYSNNILNSVFRNTSYAMPSSNIWVSLHTGDPGVAGTGNPLASCPRFVITFGAPANATMANNTTGSVVTSASGTITHLGLWDGSATATASFLIGGALTTSKNVNVGDTINLANAALTITVS